MLCGISKAYVGMQIGKRPEGYEAASLTRPLLRSQVILERAEDLTFVMTVFQELTEEDPLDRPKWILNQRGAIQGTSM